MRERRAAILRDPPGMGSIVKKICLINPSTPWAIDPMQFPPLGLGYLASSIKDIAEVMIVDRNVKKRIPKADVHGFSASTPQYPEARRFARKLECAIIGGAHVSAFKDPGMFEKVGFRAEWRK